MTRSDRLFVWTGGALFVTSLAFCTWWFLFVLGRPRPATSSAAIAVNAALVTVFALHHSLFARERVKRRLTAVIPERLLRSTYVWVASALLMLVCVWWQPVGGDLYDARGWRAVAHAIVQLAGLALIALSGRAIDPLELAGIRPASIDGGLQVAGPYRLVRHPLYLGWMLAVFGAPHMTGDRLAFALMTSLYLVIAVPWEERSLTNSFGDAYRRYQQQVRWRVLPFVY